MKDKFATYHPIVNFIYFIIVILLPLFCLHPIIVGIAFCSGAAYAACQKGIRQLRQMLPFISVIFLLSAVINPLFNRRGVTKLFRLPNGSAVTLESILYGLLAGVMLAAMILWFHCFHTVMTEDKLMQLFGTWIPAISLLFTITLRFVPKFTEQIKRVSDAQKGAGYGVTAGKRMDRVRYGLKILSITITWAFEHSIETADSMKSRGYGLEGRTVFARSRFDTRDGWMSGFIAAVLGALLLLLGTGVLQAHYYPMIIFNEHTIYAAAAYASYGILAFLPVMMQGAEELIWKYYRSKI